MPIFDARETADLGHESVQPRCGSRQVDRAAVPSCSCLYRSTEFINTGRVTFNVDTSVADELYPAKFSACAVCADPGVRVRLRQQLHSAAKSARLKSVTHNV